MGWTALSLTSALLGGCLAEDLPDGGSNGVGNRAPVAILDSDRASGPPPLTVRFDASRSQDTDGTIDGYAWEFGDGATASVPIVAHTYDRGGVFAVKLTVTDDDGATATATLTVTATAGTGMRPPVASFTVSPESGEAPLTVELDARASRDPDGRIVLHSWALGGDAQATGPTYRHTYSDVGVYDITLTVVDDDGLQASTTKTVRALNMGTVSPRARFSATPRSGPAPLMIQFDASSSEARDGTITTYTWQYGDGGSGSGEMPSYTYTRAGVFRPRLPGVGGVEAGVNQLRSQLHRRHAAG